MNAWVVDALGKMTIPGNQPEQRRYNNKHRLNIDSKRGCLGCDPQFSGQNLVQRVCDGRQHWQQQNQPAGIQRLGVFPRALHDNDPDKSDGHSTDPKRADFFSKDRDRKQSYEQRRGKK